MVCQDPQTGDNIIKKAKDELTKNHREQKNKKSFTGNMPEDSSPYCPVALFKKYLSKLNPDLSCLWQRPKDSAEDQLEKICYQDS